MANLPGRYKFLIDLFAAFTAKQYSGLPGIIQDKAYKLAWYAGGLWRWAAPGDADGNVKATAVYVSDTERISALGKVFATDVEVSSMTSGKYALAGTDGLLGNGTLSEDATNVTSTKNIQSNQNILAGKNGFPGGLFTDGDSTTWASVWWRLNGMNRFVQRYAAISDWLEIVTRNDDGSQRAVVIKIPRAQGAAVEIGSPANVAGALICRTSESVSSGIAANIATPSPYTNSTTPTSMIAAGAKTIPAGRWGVVGTTWMALFMGTIQWTNTHTIRFEVLLGATVIADSGAVTLSTLASGSIWSLTLYGTIRTVGASGTLQIDGVFRCTETGGFVAIKGIQIGTASPAAIDTTVANTFNVRVTAGTASAANIFTTRTFHFSGN